MLTDSKPPRGWGGRTGAYPSGRPSKGGANRSSNTPRERGVSVRRVHPCMTCGGVPTEVTVLTGLWEKCSCQPGTP